LTWRPTWTPDQPAHLWQVPGSQVAQSAPAGKVELPMQSAPAEKNQKHVLSPFGDHNASISSGPLVILFSDSTSGCVYSVETACEWH